MFGIGGIEIFLILIFGFLIVGPDRLPAMAKTLGKAINKFRGAQEEMNKVIKTEVYDPESKDPFKNPLEVLEKAGSSAKGSTEAKRGELSQALLHGGFGRSSRKLLGAQGALREGARRQKGRRRGEGGRREARRQRRQGRRARQGLVVCGQARVL